MMAAAKWAERTTVLSLLALAVSLLIFVVNYLLGNTIKFLADYEKHITLTRYYTGIADKLSIVRYFYILQFLLILSIHSQCLSTQHSQLSLLK